MANKVESHNLETRECIFRTSQWIPTSLESTFTFFADARNLERITPPFLKFCILTPTPIEMYSGTLIDYQLRLRGIPIRWRTKITEWDPPYSFTDIQLHGPYRKWVHQHSFYAESGGTRVSDKIHYIVPCGTIIDRLLVKPDLRKVFAYRHMRIKELLVSTQSGAAPHQKL